MKVFYTFVVNIDVYLQINSFFKGKEVKINYINHEI